MRDTEDNEVTELFNRMISEATGEGADLSDENTQKGYRAMARAIVKWQREREDHDIVVSVPAAGIKDGTNLNCTGTAHGNIT